MASAEDCERALEQLAARMDAAEPDKRRSNLDRTLRCTISDLDVAFSGRLKDGRLLDIIRGAGPSAKVQLTLSSDDLIALVDGTLAFAPAWASGRIKVGASVLDMVKLRSVF